MKPMYKTLALGIAINTVIMFLLTYVMIDSFDHFYANINRAYMAVLMAMPMVVVMLLLMPKMFPNPRLNAILYAAATGVFLLVFLGIRAQVPVGNDQFLRSMIPHHSGAIVMCEQASITDAAVAKLCEKIVRSQKEEIAEMKALLAR